jgi:hypothetical protein
MFPSTSTIASLLPAMVRSFVMLFRLVTTIMAFTPHSIAYYTPFLFMRKAMAAKTPPSPPHMLLNFEGSIFFYRPKERVQLP